MTAKWSWSSRDKPSLQDLLEVQQHFGLPCPALVEKDWHVVKALRAINAADTAPARLVFGGGTALSRAHRLIRRMSEDIDLRIISDSPLTRPALRHLRDTITDALLAAGFQFDPQNPEHRESGNASRYTLYRLPYAPIAAGQGILRPEIQIETAVWPLRLPAIERPVISFVAEAFSRAPEVPAIPCVARHIYDLYVISAHYDPGEVAALARTIMLADAKTYGHEFPAYRDNPVAETLRAVEGLAHDPDFAESYTAFRRDMVYGESPEFETALATITALAGRLE